MEPYAQSTPALAGIVLAAGLSRRMGTFKPLLPFGDQTVIEHTIKCLRASGVQTIVVVVGHRAEEIRNSLKNQKIIFASNTHPEGAMSESIKCGLEAAPSNAEAFLITPVDHAAVPAAVVKQLIEHWRGGARLVIPIWQQRGGHPVLIDGSFGAELLNMTPEGGLRSFFASHQTEIKRVPVSSGYVVRDMDTWDDYVRLHKDVFGFAPNEREGNSDAESN